jgi:dipeptidyl aminopeptidase/acylaminoacyl peptidase
MRRLSGLLAMLLLSATPLLAASNQIIPNENLVTEGIPAIPAALADKVSRYTEFRAAGLLDWHPAKREVLISTRFGDTNQVHLVRFAGGDRRQLTFFPDRVTNASFSPKDGAFFVFAKDTGGGEFYQNYRYDMATGEVTLLTDGKSRNSFGIWSKGGSLFAYTSTRRNGKDNDLYIVDPSTPTSDRKLAEVEGGGWAPLDWSKDDGQLLVAEEISINESYLWLFDAKTGERKLLTPKGGAAKIAYEGAQFSHNGKGIYVTTDRGSEFKQLNYLDLASGKFTVLTSNIPWDIETFDLSEDGKLLAFVANEDGISTLHVLDLTTKKEKKLPKLPIGVIGRISWNKNNRDLGLSLASARATSDIYSIDVVSQKLERWTQSETGGLNTENFSEPKLVKWPSFDGKMISGFLYEPPAKFTGKHPVIINIHGGPEGQSQPSFLGRNNYYLNEMGVAIILPNVRGSSGYGKSFLKLDNGFLRQDSVKDIGALLDWIKTQPNLDADRVMVTGGSYGGFMTLAAATTYNDKIRCALDVVGISNFVSFLERTESYRRDLRRVEYGDERDPKMREFLLSVSPTTKASNISKPLFVVQGQNDPRVPLNESQQMVATVKKNGSPVWYLMAKDEGHGFAKKKNQDFQFYATVTFIQQYLLSN